MVVECFIEVLTQAPALCAGSRLSSLSHLERNLPFLLLGYHHRSHLWDKKRINSVHTKDAPAKNLWVVPEPQPAVVCQRPFAAAATPVQIIFNIHNVLRDILHFLENKYRAPLPPLSPVPRLSALPHRAWRSTNHIDPYEG